MPFPSIPVWKEAPFLRLTIPFILGIIVERAFELPGIVYWSINVGCVTGILYFGSFHLTAKFTYYWVAGVLVNVLMISMGGLFTSYKNSDHPTHTNAEPGREASVLVSLNEPLREKNKTFSALSSLMYISGDSATGYGEKVILYFQKDTSIERIPYPSKVLFNQPLREISSSGNPGAFDYRQYCALQHIYHQVYLKPGDYVLIPAAENNTYERYLFAIREKVITILRTYIPGRLEAGLAEALLIGYKYDLDKDLLQTYSRTGVVHVIAISGLHLGLIYWILNSTCLLLGRKKSMRLLSTLLVICGLWLFALVAGGAPSIMRSAVMFSFIAIGASRSKKVGVYNSLALSAFVLLCYNPAWLTDAGFQLSYVAVLSIVIFMQPVYHWFLIRNRILDQTWKLTATTIAAQILTTPVIIYYFNQFPNYFLLTNLVAIPLSSLIILAEIGLCVVSPYPTLAQPTGWVAFELIRIMNAFIAHMGNMPFVTTDNLRLTPIQVAFTYIIIVGTACWLIHKSNRAFVIALSAIWCFTGAKIISDLRASAQRLMVVCNIPGQTATAFIMGKKSLLVCDTGRIQENNISNFVIRPFQNYFAVDEISFLPFQNGADGFYFYNRRIVMINKPVRFAFKDRLSVDILILSGRQKINISQLLNAIDCKQVVLDSTVPLWIALQWKTTCKQKGISFYSVAEQGAFILKLN